MEIDINQVIEIVKSVIDKYDPIELLIIGAPKDEYLAEAKLISERIYKLRSTFKIRTIIKEVFIQQFDVELKQTLIFQMSNDIQMVFDKSGVIHFPKNGDIK